MSPISQKPNFTIEHQTNIHSDSRKISRKALTFSAITVVAMIALGGVLSYALGAACNGPRLPAQDLFDKPWFQPPSWMSKKCGIEYGRMTQIVTADKFSLENVYIQIDPNNLSQHLEMLTEYMNLSEFLSQRKFFRSAPACSENFTTFINDAFSKIELLN